MKTSPILYTGSKRRLIKKGLIELFPNNIDMFVDLFSGGASVSLNTNASKYIINDFDANVVSLYIFFAENTQENIIQKCLKNIQYYKLPQSKCSNAVYKNNYIELRNEYNITKEPILLYLLLIYSFSHQIRFNSNNEFNMPCGNGVFHQEHITNIINGCKFFSQDNVFIYNKDFREIKLNKLSSKDFVYLDPPYFNTTATYNENGGWEMKDELDLFDLCEEFDKNNIKWGMSNVFTCKGKENTHLIEWCEKNKWNIYKFDNFSYSTCGKGNSNSQEVFICNY